MGFGDWLGNPGFGGFGDWGAYPVGCLGVSGFTYRLCGPYFSYVSITDFTKLFWSGDAYFGNQDSTYISYLHLSIPRLPCSDLVSLE